MRTIIDVSQDLTAIMQLSENLETQAIHNANNPLMPGGLAMVALGHIANLESWANKIDHAERNAIANGTTLEIDDDHTWEPPLQTLSFWSEAWRRELDHELDRRATITTETAFIRWALNWAWDNEPRWNDFAADIHQARQRLENTLHDGTRVAFRGAPCMYDECRGSRLIRTTVPTRDDAGNKTWRLTDWHCIKCKRSWDEETYNRNVYAAIYRTKLAIHNSEDFCTIDIAAQRINRPEATIRTWINRCEVSSYCDIALRRTFVCYPHVVARDKLATERAEKRLASKSRQTNHNRVI